MADKKKNNDAVENLSTPDNRFKLNKAKIKEMYKDDKTIRNNVNRPVGDNSTLGNLTAAVLKTNYFSFAANMEQQREYSRQAYSFYPTYSNIIDYFTYVNSIFRSSTLLH